MKLSRLSSFIVIIGCILVMQLNSLLAFSGRGLGVNQNNEEHVMFAEVGSDISITCNGDFKVLDEVSWFKVNDNTSLKTL